MDEILSNSNHPHQHQPGCGHLGVLHDGHIDFLHEGHLHHVHGSHVHEHFIEESEENPNICREIACSQNHRTSEKVPHGDHLDYLVDGRLHHVHGDHCDDHGGIAIVEEIFS